VGAVANNRITGTRWMNAPPTKGDIFIAIDVAQFTDASVFAAEMRDFLTRVEEDAPGFHMPGAGSRARREASVKNGIPVSDQLDALLRTKTDAAAGIR
jgi:LDH2 family malate/lactate/ureidoglycolate dehydrogenase